MDETTITGRLPGLDIKIMRRQAANGAEIVSISLSAMPDLASAVTRLAPALLMAPGNGGTAPVLMPMAMWSLWMQALAATPPWSLWLSFNPWLRAWIPDQRPVDDDQDPPHVR